MGSDLEDLIIEVEKAFGLRVPQAAAQSMRTVGDLVDYVRSRIGDRPGNGCITSQIFFRFRSELMQALPRSRRHIRPSEHLEVLIPINERRRVWAILRAKGLELPPLSISVPVFLTSGIVVIAAPIALAWWFHSGILLTLVLPLGLLAWLTTRPLSVHPGPYRTIRALVLYLTPVLAQDGEPQAGLSADEIADRVRLIISAQLGVSSDHLTDATRFVEDLRVD